MKLFCHNIPGYCNSSGIRTALHARIYLAGGPAAGPAAGPAGPPPPPPIPDNPWYAGTGERFRRDVVDPTLNGLAVGGGVWQGLRSGINLGLSFYPRLWLGSVRGLGFLGTETLRAAPWALGQIRDGTRWSIKKVFGTEGHPGLLSKGMDLGQEGLERWGKFVYRGTVKTLPAPIANIALATAYGVGRLAWTLPKNIVMSPFSLARGGFGVAQKIAGLGLKGIIGTPLSLLGFNSVSNAGEKLSQAGSANMAHTIDPLRDTGDVIGAIVRTVRDQTISGVENAATAWTGLATNDQWGTAQIQEIAAETANNPVLGRLIGSREDFRKGADAFRPKRYRGEKGGSQAADHHPEASDGHSDDGHGHHAAAA